MLYYIIAIFIIYKLWTRVPSPLAKIPTPPGSWPILGHFMSLIFEENGTVHTRWARTYGPFVRYNLLGTERVMVSDPVHVKQVLLNSKLFDKKLPAYSILSKITGNGLVTESDESVHKYHRSIITPAFSFKNLKSFVPIFQHKGKLLVEDFLRSADTGTPTEIKDYIAKATSDAIGEAAFSYKLNSQRDNTEKSVYNIIAVVVNTGISFLELMPFVKHFAPVTLKRMKYVRVLNEQINAILQQKIEKKQQQQNQQQSSAASEEPVKRDLLDILMESENEEGAKLTHEELLNETKTFLLAGYETSSVCILWTLYLLSKHQDIQQKLADEIIGVIGKDGIPSAEDIDKMQYLNKVFKESLRVFPPIPVIARRAAEEVTMGPYVIPKDAVVVVSIYFQHHNEKVWENPEEFNPERFSNEEEEHAKLFGSYVPFLLGVRNCIGQKFAALEVRVILAMILQKCSFTSYGPEPIRAGRITMTPKKPLHLVFSKR